MDKQIVMYPNKGKPLSNKKELLIHTISVNLTDYTEQKKLDANSSFSIVPFV